MNLSLTFVFILSISPDLWAEKTTANKFFVPKISVKMTLTGDLSEAYQFAGPLGDRLEGASEKPDSVCQNTSSFRQVLHRQEKAIQVWMSLKCGAEGQSFEYRPQPFFISLKRPDQVISIPVLSEKFRKISLQLSELIITDTPPKK